MPVPVEEGKHNGDHLDRVEEVRWPITAASWQKVDHVPLDSWHYHSIRSYLSLPKAPHSRFGIEGVIEREKQVTKL